MADVNGLHQPMERLGELHEKYGLSKMIKAEEMCNYSKFLRCKIHVC